MNLQKNFGLKVKELRVSKGYSQEAFAFQAGLDRTYITSVENGRRNVSLQTINKLLTALNISFEDFFTGFDKDKK